MRRSFALLGAINMLGATIALSSCSPNDSSTTTRPSTEPSQPSSSEVSSSDVRSTADALVAETKKQFQLAQVAALPQVRALAKKNPELDRALSERDVLKPSLATKFTRMGAGVITPAFSDAVKARYAGPVNVSYSARANGAFHLEDAKSKMAVDVAMRGAKASSLAEIGSGYLVYRGGHESGGNVIHRATPEGTEDFITVPSPEARSISYDLTLTHGVAGLRLVANNLEMLDADGTPRLRVAPPYLVDARGKTADLSLSVSGCAYDTSLAGPWHRPVTAPNATQCIVTVTIDAIDGLSFPVIVDPSWSSTTSMPTGAGNVGRMGHIAEKIGNSQILIAGGTRNGTTITNTALIFDASTTPPSWAATGSMITARYRAQSAKTGSTVVVASGSIDLNTLQTTATADVYVISGAGAGTWSLSAGSNLNTSRTGAVAIPFDDGKVLFAGGANVSNLGAQTFLKSVEIYDPADQSFSTNGAWDMSSVRVFHAASRLSDRVVLVTGGTADGTTSLSTTESFDEIGLAWTSRTAMAEGHMKHAQVTLPNGKVLAIGGDSTVGMITASSKTVELYDPTNGVNGTWVREADLAAARTNHLARVLTNGSVIVAGGSSDNSPLSSSEMFDPTIGLTGAWSNGGNASIARAGAFTMTGPLVDGTVLMIGGDDGMFTPQPNVDTFSFGLSNGAACTSNGQCTNGICVDGVCCNTLCGGGVPNDCQACSVAAGGSVDGICSNIAAQANHVCNPGGDLCEADAVCPGGTSVCPARLPKPNGAVCRPVAGDCDVAETCDGTATTCPADTFQNNATVCRPAAGDCDVAESCTGTSAECPVDAFKAPSVECRASAGACDVAEHCTGSTAMCPSDAKSTAVCRASAGACDVAESCDGIGDECPPDVKSTGVCRPEAGPCDVAEFCDGVANECPVDNFAVAASVCHTSMSSCDMTVTCSGAGAACPSSTAPDNTVCEDTGTCQAGTCVFPTPPPPPPPPSSDAGAAPSDAGSPDPDAGAVTDAGSPSPEDAGSPSSDAGTPSSDAGSPSSDAGSPSSDAGSPSSDAGSSTPDDPSADAGEQPSDSSPSPSDPTDSGSPTTSDAGAVSSPGASTTSTTDSASLDTTTPDSGCSCRTTGRPTENRPASLLGIAVGLTWMARRRRERKSS